jgi:hypothetical protein
VINAAVGPLAGDAALLRSATFRKASRSSHNNCCVEIARLADPENVVAIRDSKNPAGAVLLFGSAAFGALLDRIKAGDFDAR